MGSMRARVGVRQLRADLASHVARAGNGETIVITVDGKPVAQLAPVDAGELASLERLAATGRAVPPRRSGKDGPVPAASPGRRAPAAIAPDVMRLMNRIRG